MRALLFIILVSWFMVACASEVRQFNVRDLVMMDRMADPQISPDDQWVVFQLRQTNLDSNKGSNSIWLRSMTEGKPAQRLTQKALNATSPRWHVNSQTVFFIAAHNGVNQVWRTDLKGKNVRVVTDFPMDVGSFSLAPDGSKLLVSLEVFPDCAGDLACSKKRLEQEKLTKASGKRYTQLFIRHWDTWKNGTRSQLFAVALNQKYEVQGEPWLVTRGIVADVPSKPFGDDSEYAWSPDGQSVVFSARVGDKHEPWSTNFDLYQISSDGKGDLRNLTASNLAWDTGPVFSPDGGTLYYRAMKRAGFEADRFAVMSMDLQSKAVHELNANWDRSAETLKLSRDGNKLYTWAHHMGQAPVFMMDVSGAEVQQVTQSGTTSGLSVGRKKMVYLNDSIQSPARLYALPLNQGEASMLEDPNQNRLRGLALGEAEQFHFKGWKDELVHAWLVKPADFDPNKKYPVAFLIHGGPQGSFGNQFHYRWNAQTYAGQGFATIMIDFHGSTGYGQAFTDSISGDWGGKPLVDLQKGLQAALDRYAFLDGDRVCALGGSYGGFMTNWIAGKWPKRFRCLVTHSGVFDARMMGYATEEQWFDQWERKGNPWENPKNYEENNPIRHVQHWQTPMLVIHGQLDYRIPVEQSIAAFTALQGRKIPSEFLYFPDENHWILKPANSILWHDTVNAWLKRWLVD